MMDNSLNHSKPLHTISSTKKGIDFDDALSILSSRSKSGGEGDLSNDVDLENHNSIKRSMGQTIDLFEWTKHKNYNDGSERSHEKCNILNEKPPLKLKKESLTTTKKNTQNLKNETTSLSGKTIDNNGISIRVQNELSNLTRKGLIHALLHVQSERVSTYASFHKGLDVVLQTRNITSYPAVVAEATVSFRLQSEVIGKIRVLWLKSEKRSHEINNGGPVASVVKWIDALQTLEKKKLNLTAALHLEKIRESNEYLGLESVEISDGKEDKSGKAGDAKIAILLREGVLSLESNIASCIEEINEVLEEIRYLAAEFDDDSDSKFV